MKRIKKLKKIHIAIVLILVIAVGIIGIHGIRAKYATSVSVSGNVTISADLADSMSLYEHEAKRLPDGSYTLTENVVGTIVDPDTNELVADKGNEYEVMPGVDIPKDPQIAITGKSAIDSYLYVEIADSLVQSNSEDKENVKYKLTNSWLKLDGVIGPNGTEEEPTSVYVYTGENGESGYHTTPKVLDESFTPLDNSVMPSKETTKTIKIIDNDIITVGENYASTDFVMNIYAHLLQIPQETETAPVAAEVFVNQLPPKGKLKMSRTKNLLSTAASDGNDAETTTSGEGSSAKVEVQAEQEIEYVSIKIQYIDSSTKIPVFDDYVATLRSGTEFTASVKSPTRVGYAPYINNVLANTVDIEEKVYTEDVVYTVEYKPIEVSYTIRHYIQNVSDDSYMEFKTETDKTMLTGSKPTTEALSLKELVGNESENIVGGYESLYHEPDTVAADGSTEFHVYYDRKYFLYTFDCDGGYGVDPIYARYETPLSVPTPVKPGYTFTGWQLDGTIVDIDEKVGLADKDYKATWTPNPTGSSYTIVYWKETADADVEGQPKKYSFWGSEKIKNVEAESYVSGLDCGATKAAALGMEDYKYFIYDADATDKNIQIAGDGSTVVNVYYTRKTYKLKFYYARSKTTNGITTYQIVGGSSHSFAKTAISNTNLQNPDNYLPTLFNTITADAWGDMGELPALNANGIAKGYSQDDKYTDSYGGYNYHYLLLEAKYEQNISNLFPVEIFDGVKTNYTLSDGTAVNHFGEYAYFSSWNVQNGCQYAVENWDNPTVKGNYQYLDKSILARSGLDLDTLHFLAFWENGSIAPNWNRPKPWTYKLYIPAFNPDGDEKEVSFEGVVYDEYATYHFYDDAGIDGQTEITLAGYELLEKVDMSYTLRNEENKIVFEDVYRYTKENGVHLFSQLDTVYPGLAHFYYKREEYKLIFDNHGDTYQTIENVQFGSSLKGYEIKEDDLVYPSNLEAGAYKFDGWYTTPEGGGGVKVTWDTLTMPDGDLMLYARWVPQKWTVTFSNHYLDERADVYIDGFTYQVLHGENLQEKGYKAPSMDPDKGEISAEGIGNAERYTPIGWFYIDSATGEKKRFNPGSMNVTSNLNLFMEWKSNHVVTYTIDYYLVDEDGNRIAKIADTLMGRSFAGLTRTFEAKIGTELYATYQEGYYPKSASHSILMTEATKNEYVFEYVYVGSVGYTIKYINQLTKLPMEGVAEKNDTTKKAVLTEKFAPISGYVPDAFYKRMVLSSDASKNIICFYYTEDTKHAYYAVKHEIEDSTTGDTVNYKTYATITGIADIMDANGNQNSVTENALSISGYSVDITTTQAKAAEMAGEGSVYTVDVTTGNVTGKVVNSGLEMYIYYKKNSYPYKIQFKEYGTEDELHETYTGNGKFGDSINVNIASFVGFDGTKAQDLRTILKDNIEYNLISDPTRTFAIRASTSNSDVQTITFYYQAREVQFNYEAVCYEAIENINFGYVSPSSERTVTVDKLGGSTPMAERGYRFVNWYTDSGCTTAINASWIDANGRLIPQELPQENEITYYALFEPILSELTLEKVGTDISDTDTFLFRVKGKSGGTANIDLMVSITGPNSLTISNLPIGIYTVTELTGWSWRYEGVSEAIEVPVSEITEDYTNKIVFKNVSNPSAWLGGESIKENSFEAFKPTT